MIVRVASLFFAGACFDFTCLSQWNRDDVVLAISVVFDSPKSGVAHPGAQHRTPGAVTEKAIVAESDTRVVAHSALAALTQNRPPTGTGGQVACFSPLAYVKQGSFALINACALHDARRARFTTQGVGFRVDVYT